MERNTPQKQSVLNVLKSLRGEHPTAETVYERASQSIPSISRATVYRILNQFAGQGVISQLHIPESADRYDDFISPHYHLLCQACKRVIDLPDLQFERIPLPKKNVSGCRITGIELAFLGICSECVGNE